MRRIHAVALALLASLPGLRGEARPDPATLDAAIRLGAHYLVKVSRPDGSFQYVTHRDPTVTIEDRYNILRHCGTLYALADYHRRSRDEVVAPVLKRGAEFVRKRTIAPLEGVDGAAPVWSLPEIHGGTSPRLAKLGGSGIALVGLISVNQTLPETTPLETLQGLGRFILFMQRKDGSFYSRWIPSRGGYDTEWTSLYYPGEAALGLLMLHEQDQDPRWLQAATNALLYLARSRHDTTDVPADHWALLATARLFQIGKVTEEERKALTLHALQVVDAILWRQSEYRRFPQARGGFHPAGATTPTATCLEGLLATLTWLPKDHWKRDTIRKAIDDSLPILLQGQFREDPLKGGVPRALATIPVKTDRERRFNNRVEEVRIDYVQHALSALMQYRDLEAGNGEETP